MDLKRKNQIAVALLLSAVISYVLIYPLSDETKAYVTTVFGVLLLLFAYFSGLLSFIIALVSSLIGFILSLPGLAALYGFVAGYSLFIYNRIFGYTIKKIINRVPFIQNMIYKIETNETYAMVCASLDRMLATIGLKKIRRVKLYEITSCPHCMKEIPVESRTCMYCGKEVTLE